MPMRLGAAVQPGQVVISMPSIKGRGRKGRQFAQASILIQHGGASHLRCLKDHLKLDFELPF